MTIPEPHTVPVRDRVEDRLMHAGIARSLLETNEPDRVTLGRFEVVERIGVGGMSAVYRARDHQLGRDVALKVLDPQRVPSGELVARLMREAGALARLNHPNVVTVYEAGRDGDEVFVAMELVDGIDLGAWVRAHPVGAADRFATALDIVCQAARGLMAAHRAGLVHRDFKPSNVLVGTDGRVRVADFGLARAVADDSTMTREVSPPATDGSQDASRTQTGAVLGTPGYMSPEQRDGLPVDQRTDQFAFSVTAWEVLFGRHPFPRGIDADEDPAAPPGAAPRLVAALRRGLQRDPEQRHSTIEALLAGIELATRRRRRVPAVVAASIVSIGIVAAAVASTRSTGPSECEMEADRIDASWGSAQRDTLAAAFDSGGSGSSEATARLISDRLDGYAAGWRAIHLEACETDATGSHIGVEPRRCLDDRLRELDALVSVLTAGGTSIANRAVDAAWGLPSVELCTDARYVLATEPPQDADASARVERVRTELARADALDRTGQYEEARTLLTAALPDAREIGHAPLTVDVLGALGRIEFRGHDRDVGAKLLEEAFELALASGYEHGAHNAALKLMDLEASFRGRPDAATVWEKVAVALHERVAGDDPGRASALLHKRGLVAIARGDHEAARELLTRAVETLQGLDEAHGNELALALNALGNLAMNTGAYADAVGVYERARPIFERAYGPEHPGTAAVINNLGVALFQVSQFDRAEQAFVRALAIRRAAFAGKGPEVGNSLTALANLHAQRGDPKRARPFAAEAVELLRVGGSGEELANALMNLSLIDHELDDHARALAGATEALELRERGGAREAIAESLVEMSVLHLAEGDVQRSDQTARRAVALFEEADARHPSLVQALAILGDAQRAEGDIAGARASYARSLAIAGPDHPARPAIEEEARELSDH